jgi:hypothetical protein
MSKNHIDADAAKLAGLQIDLLSKVRKGKITLDEFKNFLNKPKRHFVNLAENPRPPFEGAEVVKHDITINGKSQVELKPVGDELFVDGIKIILHLSERQIGDRCVAGHELRKELEDGEQLLLNSNVLDYLYDHPELFPKHWKKDENGETRYIYFWGTIFRDTSDDCRCIRCLYRDDGCLKQSFYWLDPGWYRQNLSAVLAS